MTPTIQERQNLQNRLRTARGHMRAIARMIEDDAPCTTVVRQMLAVRGAMRAIERELWRAYLRAADCELRSDDAEERLRAGRALQKMLSEKPER